MLTGQLGTLNKDGKQVGGFLDWQINAILNPARQTPWKAYKESAWRGKANKFWILEKLEGDEFYATFYQRIRDRLVIVSQLDVRVKVPNAPLNTVVMGNLEMRRV